MLADVTRVLYNTVEDLRLHCVSSYWIDMYYYWHYLLEFGDKRFAEIPWNVIKVFVCAAEKVNYRNLIKKNVDKKYA